MGSLVSNAGSVSRMKTNSFNIFTRLYYAKAIASRTKFRKVHKGRVRGVASRGNKVSFGEFGIQSLTREG